MELKRNILDIKGIKVGQAENPTAKTGVSVVLAEDGAICGVDVRGAGPGTRETDLLNPINTVDVSISFSCSSFRYRLCLRLGGGKRCHELA